MSSFDHRGDHLRHGGVGRVRMGQVRLDPPAVTGPLAEFVHHRGGAQLLPELGRGVQVDVEDRDACAEVGQPQRAGPSNAARASGDDRYGIGEQLGISHE